MLSAGHFVEPILVAEIHYREISHDAILRHPSFRGIRADIPPTAVHLPDNS
ncbi:hypothetical protein [Nocardia iowensis]|uniref:ATP dependent DNA ligase n=1 Tax=Nocardia iowensis TaxID=204891 RepID=UPI001FE6A7A7|nr:hypothetical protein [Nocardia iowensis]